jgi:hypothetical protein
MAAKVATTAKVAAGTAAAMSTTKKVLIGVGVVAAGGGAGYAYHCATKGTPTEDQIIAENRPPPLQ